MKSLEEFIGKIWSSSSIFEPIEYLADTIGPRPAGSGGCEQAKDFIVNTMTNFSFDVQLQHFNHKRWKNENTTLKLGIKEIPSFPYDFSENGNITAKIVHLQNPNENTLEELDCSELIVLYENSMNFMGARGFSREKIIETVEQKGALAFIEMNNQPGGIIQKCALQEKSKIPIISVSYEAGSLILRKKDKQISLNVSGSFEEIESTNIISSLKATNKKEILVLAHYDSTKHSPGAFDNGTGIATTLELARDISQFNQYQLSIKFVFLSASKVNNSGATAFINKFLSTIDEQSSIFLVMNYDTTAIPHGTRNGVLANNLQLFGNMKSFLDKNGYNINFTPMPIFGTDAVPFYNLKLPIFVLNQWKTPSYINTIYDTPEKLSIDSLKNSTAIAGAVLWNSLSIAPMFE